jgi:signal transduction histidine kinase
MSEDKHEKLQIMDDDYLEQKIIERMSHISSELAHDLRSPLQTIQNAIYLLERNPSNEQLYVMVRQSVSQATEILDSFRDYYKAHILQRVEVDPIMVLDLALSQIEIPDNIILKREDNPVPSISIDATKIALVIRKLLENAVEAMPDGGELVVKLNEESGGVEIIIKDTGKGISPEMSEIIYTPFMAESKNGRGLGIPTAKRIIESHGGALIFESKVDYGTTFTIFIPHSAVNL